MRNNKTHKEQLFQTQMGQAATVQREDVRGDNASRANVKLASLGQENNPIPGSLKYMGSAALHIYWNETLEQVFFVSQAQPLIAHKCPEPLAMAGTKDMIGAVMEAFGHRRPKLRSGF